MENGTFSKEMNISIDTLRYYDKIGLLVPCRKGSKRVCSIFDKDQLLLIKNLNLVILHWVK